MLSSQFENLILEYKQDVTVKKMGEALVARFAKDVIANPEQLRPATKKVMDALAQQKKQLFMLLNQKVHLLKT